ncbi:uncharacterized protein N7483_005882 [Penicillium malachiteum]|uniref:uncharacterized protein n=1 Tax=Penicillium malachiteum TaxID=1324776 RepID=UPI002547F05C|nr:uncharacterized protein N7483_005882 [Penicillium malachiteum]KAJ5731374.1 hypothetical protein N7483_005882 [Penicillium malachiteum]
MPPKRARNSGSGISVNATTLTLTPSRRSPRSPKLEAPSPSLNNISHSNKHTFSSSPSSEDIRLYYPKTPPSTKSVKTTSSSPDLPSTHRRKFQARPSRLSTVYTPVVDTPNSSGEVSRQSRRVTALNTPQDPLSDHEVPDSIGSTGWTFDQYMSGYDTAMDPTSPSAASSKTTRSSARLRKPTSRAVEASLEPKKQTRRGLVTPATTTNTTKEETSESSTGQAQEPAKATTQKASKGKKGTNKKASKVQAAPKDMDIDIEAAGLLLYQVAVEALGPDFVLPADPEWELNNARFNYFQSKTGAQRIREATPQNDDDQHPDLYDSEADTGVCKFKKTSEPSVAPDGYLQLGVVNRNGEEVFIHPAACSPYWMPRTYGDESLPYPPVRVRSSEQQLKDTTLGFPPLIGDRNTPFDVQSQFVAEALTAEEQARVHARDELRQNAAAAIPDAPEPRKARAKRRQSAPATEVDEPKPKRRRGGTRASMPSASADNSTGHSATSPNTNKPRGQRKTPAPKPTKAMAKKAGSGSEAARKTASNEAQAAGDDVQRPIIRLKLSAPKPEVRGSTESSSQQSAETPRVASDAEEVSTPAGRKRATPAAKMSTPRGSSRTRGRDRG